MYWREAIKLSPNHKAVRRTKDGRLIVVYDDHTAIIQQFPYQQLYFRPKFRKAYPNEYIGYTDWQPME